MRKIYTLLLLLVASFVSFAQQVTLTFTGREATTNAYVQLSRIEITDLTQGWTETLTYPDTVAILSVGTGIEENAATAVFGLTQNNPNPFNGTTDVNLTITESGPVLMEITDVNGRKIVEKLHATSLQTGTHQFRINVSDAGIYFLTARQNGKTSSVKMVNSGNGTGNSIAYMCSVAQSLQTKNGTKGAINRAFAYGDAMTYKGFSNVGGEEAEGEVISQAQTQSETITLLVQIDGQPCPGATTLTDVDSNTYNTVLIGTQCWMKENLKTTKYADGTSISQGSNLSTTTAYWYYPDGTPSNKATYGLLYNWPAVMGNSTSSATNPSGVQGICPTGWHLPSDAEWTQLTNYVKSQSAYVCGECSGTDDEWDTYCIAKALASTTGWNSSPNTCDVGNAPSINNATGFGALPAGYYYDSYYDFSNYALFWSATEDGSSFAYYRVLYSNSAGVDRNRLNKDGGFSVRCLRD